MLLEMVMALSVVRLPNSSSCTVLPMGAAKTLPLLAWHDGPSCRL